MGIFKNFRGRIGSRLGRKGVRASAIDFGGLLAVLAKLLGDCFGGGSTPEEVIEKAKSGDEGARHMLDKAVRLWLREDYGFGAWRRMNGEQIVDGVLEEAATAKPDELLQIVSEG